MIEKVKRLFRLTVKAAKEMPRGLLIRYHKGSLRRAIQDRFRWDEEQSCSFRFAYGVGLQSAVMLHRRMEFHATALSVLDPEFDMAGFKEYIR